MSPADHSQLDIPVLVTPPLTSERGDFQSPRSLFFPGHKTTSEASEHSAQITLARESVVDSSSSVEERKRTLEKELYLHKFDGWEQYLDAAFKDIVPPAKIEEFLHATPLYCFENESWTGIPREPGKAGDLHQPYMDFLGAIFVHFDVSGRFVMNTSRVKPPHIDRTLRSDSSLRTSPHLSILTEIPCTMTRRTSEDDIYSYMVTPIEVATERTQIFHKDLRQMSVYARQCFMEQHTRRFVYSMILTERYLQLFQFDRSGCVFSDRRDIHANPRALVRILLGLSSSDPRVVGYDPSVAWYGDQRLMKVKMKDKPFAMWCEVMGKTPFFFRRAIQGRGTLCWRVRIQGRVCIVKEAWRSMERQSDERRLLEAVKGLRGVGQPFANDSIQHEAEERVSDFRWIHFIPGNSPERRFSDRIWSRVFLEEYGSTIEGFTSAHELLYALRDAVLGHQNLLGKSILHRDISVGNILIGRKGSKDGNRGVLIDLDMAIFLNEKRPGEEWRTGTYTFQSYHVLNASCHHPMDHVHPQDYLDDLESFLYVLCWVCFGFERPGQRVQQIPAALESWKLQSAAASKHRFLDSSHKHALQNHLPGFFGQPFAVLISSLCTLMRVVLLSKHEMGDLSSDDRASKGASMLATPDVYYSLFVGFIDQAISALGDEPTRAIEGDAEKVEEFNAKEIVERSLTTDSNVSNCAVLSFDPDERVGHKRNASKNEDNQPVTKRLRVGAESGHQGPEGEEAKAVEQSQPECG